MAKILLVEDDNNLREIYQARLVAEGYDIVAAQNGEEALVVAKQNKPDLIISDVMMPRISGFEMLDILRNTEELKRTKVIMLTALGQAEDQKRAGNLGADKYLVKSQVTLEDIVKAAEELLTESGATMPTPEAPAEPAAVEPAAPEAIAPPADTAPETPAASAPAATEQPVAAPSAANEPATTAPAVPMAVEPPAPTEPALAPAASLAPEPAAAAPATPVAVPVAEAPVSEPVVPASVVPQPDTSVVVPPAPASPTPPTVTVAAVSPDEPTSNPTPVASEPSTSPAPAPDTSAMQDAVADAATESLEKEEAELQAQIDNYAKQPAEAAIAVEPTPESASNDETLADAVEALNTPSEEPLIQPPSVVNAVTPTESEPPVADTPAPVTAEPAPAPEPSPTAPAASSTGDNVSVVGKKVIQPLGAIEKPNLDDLLAKEEAKNIMTPAPAPAPAAPAAPAAATPPVLPAAPASKPFDPNTAL